MEVLWKIYCKQGFKGFGDKKDQVKSHSLMSVETLIHLNQKTSYYFVLSLTSSHQTLVWKYKVVYSLLHIRKENLGLEIED